MAWLILLLIMGTALGAVARYLSFPTQDRDNNINPDRRKKKNVWVRFR